MSATATDSMRKLDELINKYAPVDLATSKLPDSVMAIDLRNIRHHALSILCELTNLERQHDSLQSDMRQLKDFVEHAKRAVEAYKHFIRDYGEETKKI